MIFNDFVTFACFSIAYCLISVVGIIGNIAVFIVVTKSPQMRTLTNQFIANLAIADLFVNILCVPFTLVANLYPGECRLDFIFLVFEKEKFKIELTRDMERGRVADGYGDSRDKWRMKYDRHAVTDPESFSLDGYKNVFPST